ncbi:WecB/TagA/CpsF family glycosyltransferase [Candidatus Saccharibacteria bacterium]|nr:WecB/TagA/CpsF family glycosyltransferase [Candidatus Saccharibacteria bacterium]
MNKTHILGFEIDTYRANDLIDQLVSKCLDKRSETFRVIQINPEILVAANYSKHIKKLIDGANYKVANGVGVQWAAQYSSSKKNSFYQLIKSLLRIITKPEANKQIIPDLFNSSSLTKPLLRKLDSHSSKLLIAASPKNSNLNTTLNYLRSKFEGLEIFGFDSSKFDGDSMVGLTKLAKNRQPDLILLGIGFPLQEEVASKLKSELSHGVIITEGGTFDYEAFGGKIKRAPSAVQKIGLEWLWRLIEEPSRLKRQLSLMEFIKLVHKSSKKH